jgi:hypothetical protein
MTATDMKVMPARSRVSRCDSRGGFVVERRSHVGELLPTVVDANMNCQ